MLQGWKLLVFFLRAQVDIIAMRTIYHSIPPRCLHRQGCLHQDLDKPTKAEPTLGALVASVVI